MKDVFTEDSSVQLVAQPDYLCIDHWLFVLIISESYQQRDRVQQFTIFNQALIKDFCESCLALQYVKLLKATVANGQ